MCVSEEGLGSGALRPQSLTEPLRHPECLPCAAAAGATGFSALAGRKTQLVLEEKLKSLEEECRQKESERVNLELELTEVKESLRKALAGGITLGLAIEPRSGTSSPQVTSARAPELLHGHGVWRECPAPLKAAAHPSLTRHSRHSTVRFALKCSPTFSEPLLRGGTVCVLPLRKAE